MTADSKRSLRIAAFGFRSIPPTSGCAGADKFASELLPRLAERGYSVVGYNRLYPGQDRGPEVYRGVQLRYFKTVNHSGFDTLLHSLKSTFDIIRYNTADVVHIQNGGNSIFGVVLRIAGKRVFLSQDGVDWKRDKWPPYGSSISGCPHSLPLTARQRSFSTISSLKRSSETASPPAEAISSSSPSEAILLRSKIRQTYSPN